MTVVRIQLNMDIQRRAINFSMFSDGVSVMNKRHNRYLEFRNISRNMIDWFEDIAEENNCHIEKKEWKSKYNSYVTYDYEPFCSDGFEINVLVSAIDMSYLNFLKYLYNEKINTIDFLNNCAKMPSVRNYI